jgi:hypothetical protein
MRIESPDLHSVHLGRRAMVALSLRRDDCDPETLLYQLTADESRCASKASENTEAEQLNT